MSVRPERPSVVAEGLSKAYQLWENPRDRLRHAVRNTAARRLPLVKPKSYGREFWALRDVSFELHPGETLGVIGRNGSGKSTLLQLICGTLTPTSGSFETAGRVSALLELGSGFNPEFTGRENVYMNASILGLTKPEIDTRYADIVAFADIGDFVDQPVQTYSSGMFVRLAFAVVAHVDAEILVVDEALAVGDAFFTQKCMRYMRRFRERGTLLFVSHDSGAVVNLCDRVIMLDAGRVKADGPAVEVCDLYLEEMFAAQQSIDGSVRRRTAAGVATSLQPVRTYADAVDQRAKYVNVSAHRNDIEVFTFSEDSRSFGAGGARILNVALLDPATGAKLSWVVGGELVTLVVEAKTLKPVEQPILGFMVKDRLGQTLFADNTYLTYQDHPPAIPAGATFEARFTLRMPILPPGPYVIAASVAGGTQTDHVQLDWLHEALAFSSHTASTVTGLVGVPAVDIVMEITTTEEG